MSSYERYCPLCGVVCGPIYEPTAYDDSIIAGQADRSWTRQVVVISENPNLPTLSKAYVTGLGSEPDRGYYEVKRGNDPNFNTKLRVTDQDHVDESQWVYAITVHQWKQTWPFAIPMHEYCYWEILPRIVNSYTTERSISIRSMSSVIDKDVIYHVLKGLYSRNPYSWSALLAEFKEARDNQREMWVTRKGEEWLVKNPYGIDELENYYENLPKITGQTYIRHQAIVRNRTFAKVSQNAFSVLPTEIIYRLLKYLSIRDIDSLRASTPAVAQVELSRTFWKSRVKWQMPWLYDLPFDEQEVDWRTVHIQLQSLSNEISSRKFDGLVNRRKIWTICDQIARKYVTKKLADDEAATNWQSGLLAGAGSSRMPMLIWPEPPDGETGNMLLIDDIMEIGRRKLTITVFMRNDLLLGLSVAESLDTMNLRSVGTTDSSATPYHITVEEGDWIVGLIFFSKDHDEGISDYKEGRSVCGIKILTRSGRDVIAGRQSRDERISHVTKGNMVIGMRSVWSQQRGISKLGLLETSSAGSFHPFAAGTDILASYAESAVSQHLWRGDLPIPELFFGDFHSGWWSLDRVTDVAAKQCLVLGTTEAELSLITAIAIDLQLLSVRVDYADGVSKSIGPLRWAMQLLSIDGKEGERVIAFETQTNHVPEGLRIVTNWGRQLVVGRMDRGPRRRAVTDSSQVVVGVCGHWTREPSESVPEAGWHLDMVAAVFLRPSQELVSSDLSEIVDDLSSTDIIPIPTSWEPLGRVLGDEINAERTAFLDFSRPLVKIDFLLTHQCRTTSERLQLASMIVTYEDHTTASIGATDFSRGSANGRMGSYSWCERHCYQSMLAKETFGRSHYHTVSWTLRKQKVKYLHVWRYEETLYGIQFVAEDGSQSPQLGQCYREPKDVIVFGGGEREVLGLRCFVGSNRRDVTLPDMIVVALQAVGTVRANQPADSGDTESLEDKLKMSNLDLDASGSDTDQTSNQASFSW